MRWEKCSSSRIAGLAFLVLPALIAISGIVPGESLAEGLSGYLEFDYSRNDTENKDAGGQSTKTKSDSLSQLYNLTLDRRLYPNLNFLASGLFRIRDTSFDIEGLKTDTTTTTLRPYVNLNLRTPLSQADAAYSRNEEEGETPCASTPP